MGHGIDPGTKILIVSNIQFFSGHFVMFVFLLDAFLPIVDEILFTPSVSWDFNCGRAITFKQSKSRSSDVKIEKVEDSDILFSIKWCLKSYKRVNFYDSKIDNFCSFHMYSPNFIIQESRVYCLKS